MPNLNKVLIMGHLTRDPETRFLENEKCVANFGLAINHHYKGADGTKKEEVTFVDIEAWGRTAELCGQYLTKGKACFIEGRLKLDSWDDKDGNKRQKLKVVADNVQFLGGKSAGDEGGQRPAVAAPKKPTPIAAGNPDDEPPF